MSLIVSVIIGRGLKQVKSIPLGIYLFEMPMQYDPLVLFGKRLAELRKAKGWSQERLALESGLARSYVGGIERGQRNIALYNICVLAETLGVPPSSLLSFDNLVQERNAPKGGRSRER
jgi:DNA-binding XRE family transcriptional regulator